jgi:hypothetical protein
LADYYTEKDGRRAAASALGRSIINSAEDCPRSRADPRRLANLRQAEARPSRAVWTSLFMRPYNAVPKSGAGPCPNPASEILGPAKELLPRATDCPTSEEGRQPKDNYGKD